MGALYYNGRYGKNGKEETPGAVSRPGKRAKEFCCGIIKRVVY
jgi:hypothetical protein